MCGRFALDDKVNAAITEFVEQTGRKPEEWAPDWESRWNIAPTTQIAVLLDSAKDRQLRFERARWSLVPPWSETISPKFPTFNARTEGITEKATWKRPLKTSRCIIPANGYYEWTGEKGKKQPWWIHPEQGHIGFAGLYSWWRPKGSDDDWTLTATILTTATVPHLADIHDRNPVILPQALWEHWIDPTVTGDQALVDEAVAAHQSEAEALDYYEVQPFKTGDSGPDLVAPAA